EPFDADDTTLLRLYRDRCRKVSECSFLQHKISMNVRPREGRIQDTLDHAGVEARSHFLMMLRPLHAQKEGICFPKIAALLRRHAESKGGEAASRAIEWIGEYQRDRKRIWKEGSLEIREAGGDHVVKPSRVFDTFLKGEDFHVNPKEAAILDRLHLPAVYGFV